jgi:hypothetical protein
MPRGTLRLAMEDPGLWLAFFTTVVAGYVLFAAIERRQGVGRRTARHDRGR